MVETLTNTADGWGHGPDIGSDEWQSVIEFRLGLDPSDIPERRTSAWCEYIDRKIKQPVAGQMESNISAYWANTMQSAT